MGLAEQFRSSVGIGLQGTDLLRWSFFPEHVAPSTVSHGITMVFTENTMQGVSARCLLDRGSLSEDNYH